MSVRAWAAGRHRCRAGADRRQGRGRWLALAAGVAVAAAVTLRAGDAAASEPASGTLTLELLPVAETSGPVVLLSEVTRRVAGDPALFEEWGELPVGTAPLPGEVRTLSRGAIELRLRQARVDLARLRWHGEAAAVEVRGAGKPVSPQQVADQLDRHVRSLPGLQPPLRVAALEEMPEAVMPRGPVEIRVVSSPPALRPGTAVFSVELRHGSGLVRRLWVRARLEAAAADGAGPGALAAAGPATGPQLAAPAAEAGGRPVVLVVRRGQVLVETDGLLVDDGPVGGWVRVVSLATGQVVHGIRVAADRVSVVGNAGP